jgi:hypothetical protein
MVKTSAQVRRVVVHGLCLERILAVKNGSYGNLGA